MEKSVYSIQGMTLLCNAQKLPRGKRVLSRINIVVVLYWGGGGRAGWLVKVKWTERLGLTPGLRAHLPSQRSFAFL